MKSRKKLSIFTGVLLCLSLAGCSFTENNESVNMPIITPAPTESAVLPTESAVLPTESAVLPKESTVAEMGVFTKEQALVDYEYMWEVLENNYPSFALAERMLGIDTKEIKENGYLLIKNSPKMSLEYFYTIVEQTLSKFDYIYHLTLIEPGHYKNIQRWNERSLKEGDVRYSLFVPNWEKSTEVYQYIDEKLFDNKPVQSTMDTVPEVPDWLKPSFTIIDEKTALITIPTFREFDFVAENQQLAEFYKQAEGYENLIFDISQNGGGSDRFWMLNIVAPNIEQSIPYYNSFLGKNGKENIEYWKARGIPATEETIEYWKKRGIPATENIFDMDNLANKEKLTAMNQEDFQEMGVHFVWGNTVPTETGEKAFKGNIYVLIDKPVFSSSESFTLFCKQTGFATLVGKNSGGDGGGFNPLLISLPESSLLFQYATLYSLNEDGSSNQEFGTTPDYLCEGDETPLEACLRVIKMKSGE